MCGTTPLCLFNSLSEINNRTVIILYIYFFIIVSNHLIFNTSVKYRCVHKEKKYIAIT